MQVCDLVAVHREVDGGAYRALHRRRESRVHEQCSTSSAYELCHLRSWWWHGGYSVAECAAHVVCPLRVDEKLPAPAAYDLRLRAVVVVLVLVLVRHIVEARACARASQPAGVN